jgi:hypothetical protein
VRIKKSSLNRCIDIDRNQVKKPINTHNGAARRAQKIKSVSYFGGGSGVLEIATRLNVSYVDQ